MKKRKKRIVGGQVGINKINLIALITYTRATVRVDLCHIRSCCYTCPKDVVASIL